MAENLKYLPSVVGPGTGSDANPYYYVYGYDGTDVQTAKATSNYNTYGVLYNWPAAMAGDGSSSANPSGVQGICPAGWHFPSDAEWTELVDFVTADGHSGTEGTALKATNGWIGGGNGTDNYSFSALPGGYRYTNGNFDYVGSNGSWWSSTEYGSNNAWFRTLYYNYTSFYRSDNNMGNGFSVRCVRD